MTSELEGRVVKLTCRWTRADGSAIFRAFSEAGVGASSSTFVLALSPRSRNRGCIHALVAASPADCCSSSLSTQAGVHWLCRPLGLLRAACWGNKGLVVIGVRDAELEGEKSSGTGVKGDS